MERNIIRRQYLFQRLYLLPEVRSFLHNEPFGILSERSAPAGRARLLCSLNRL